MSKIKTRESTKNVKAFDKAATASERMKSAFIRSKDQAENLMDDGQISPSEYAEDKLRYIAEDVTERAGHDISSEAKKAVDKGKDTYRKHRQERLLKRNEARVRKYEGELQRRDVSVRRNQTIKSVQHAERNIKHSAHSAGNMTVKAGIKGSVKTNEKVAKTAEITSKAAIKTAEKAEKSMKRAAETTAKSTRKATERARQASAKAYKRASKSAKAIAAEIKAIVAETKAMVMALAAGGWIVVVTIIIICMIGLIVGSGFGIFFSGEDRDHEQSMRQVVQEVNTEYQKKLDDIKASTKHDKLEMSGSRAVWPEVLSVYAVKTVNNPDNPQDVATMTDEKKKILKDIFWAMNEISHRTETKSETIIVESDDGNGNIKEEEVTEARVYLYITVSHKTAGEMASSYNFTAKQNEELEDLLSQDSSMWATVLYGVYGANDQIVAVALSQIGNIGGEPYWSWYGFGSRVEWCACFVSWCANQCGYIENGVCPKFAGCVNGVQWFKNRGQWADNSIEPAPGMIIFFDWDNLGESGPQDGLSEHTGIVEKVENGTVYTIEGNSDDQCVRRNYPLGYYEILGYGILNP